MINADDDDNFEYIGDYNEGEKYISAVKFFHIFIDYFCNSILIFLHTINKGRIRQSSECMSVMLERILKICA